MDGDHDLQQRSQQHQGKSEDDDHPQHNSQHSTVAPSSTLSSSTTSTTRKQQQLLKKDETVDKLKELLRKEAHNHKETGNCYNTLQLEYDDLLRKYAEAENTIDKLRIGARIKLYYDCEPNQQQQQNIVMKRFGDDQVFQEGMVY